MYLLWRPILHCHAECCLSLSLFLASKTERERADIEDKQHAASLGAADTSALIFPELRPSPPPPVEKLF